MVGKGRIGDVKCRPTVSVFSIGLYLGMLNFLASPMLLILSKFAKSILFFFHFELPSVMIEKRNEKKTFLSRLSRLDTLACSLVKIS